MEPPPAFRAEHQFLDAFADLQGLGAKVNTHVMREYAIRGMARPSRHEAGTPAIGRSPRRRDVASAAVDRSPTRRPDSHAIRDRTARLPGVDGLRALAALAVLVQHVWRFGDPQEFSPDWGIASAPLPHLRIGLTLFFVLSGFLLYRPFVRALYDGARRPSFRAYYASRALRILPAYWVILLLVAVVLQSALVRVSVTEEQYTGLGDPVPLVAAALFVQNYVPGWLMSGIGVAWSLNVEVVFYLVLPLLVMLAATLAGRATTQRGRRLALLSPAVVLVAVGATGKVAAEVVDPVGPAIGFDGDWHSVIVRSFWYHAPLFAPGIVLAVVSVAAERRREMLPPRWRLGALVAIPVALWAALETYRLYGELTALACALLVALVVLPLRHERMSRLTRFFESRPLCALGLVSYSVFLWHGPIIDFLREHGFTASGQTGFLINLALVSVITGALATLTYRYVELPALRLKKRQRTTVSEPPALSAAQHRAAP